MDTLVITPTVLPINENSTETITFPDCKWTVSDCGVLSVLTDARPPSQVAAFGAGSWSAAITAEAAR